jgi:hypothetical protein
MKENEPKEKKNKKNSKENHKLESVITPKSSEVGFAIDSD